MSRRICVVTGSRADYGLLRWVMRDIVATPGLRLQVVATGMHLSPAFGLTYREIENDGISIDTKIETLLDADTPTALAKSMGLGLIGFGEALHRLQPDVLLVLGDRFEVFSAVAAGPVAGVPVGPRHGGEVSVGAVDEGFRPYITKMSHLHFVAAEDYQRRVIQLGEDPSRVFLVGGLGLDSIQRLKLLTRPELEEALGFELGPKCLLATFHPVTLEPDTSAQQVQELLAALDEVRDTRVIFTLPNADPGNRPIIDLVAQHVADRPHTKAFTSLGQLLYLSCLQYVDAVVGNSSSGLIEAPAFRKGTINIGDRQRGRLRAASVIDCKPDRVSIVAALRKMYSAPFQATLGDVCNPYGDGGASQRVVQTLRDVPLDNILKKHFCDLSPSVGTA